MKKAHVAFGPLTIGALRVTGGVAMLYLLWHLFRSARPKHWPIQRIHLLPLAIPVLAGAIFPFVMQPYLIGKYQNSAFFGMMVSFTPLLTILISVPMLGQLPRLREAAGVLIGLGCMFVLFSDGRGKGVSWFDFALAVSVPLSYSISNTFIKRRFTDVSPLALSCSAMAIAGLVLAPVGWTQESVQVADPVALRSSVIAALLLGMFGTGLATYFYYHLIQSHGPLFASMVTYIVPLGALMWGWADSERVSATQLFALVGILIAVGIVQWPIRRKAVVADLTDDDEPPCDCRCNCSS